MVIETSQKYTFEVHEYAIDEVIWMTDIDPKDEVHSTIKRRVDDADGAVWAAVNGAIIDKIDSFWKEAWIT